MVRATRKDQAQEDLVSKKDEINQRTSKIIDLLIETKNSWNGKPAPGIGVSEPHSLKEPLPPETTSTMDHIVQEVQEVNSKLKDIDKHQSGYQQDRRDKRERESKKENKGEEPLDLSSIASNIGTRFMSHIKAPFQFGDSEKWGRLRLLRASAKVERHLEDMQGYILSSNNEAIPSAVYKAKDLFHIFENEIADPMIAAIKELPERAPEAPKEQESNISEQEPEPDNTLDRYQPADIIEGSRLMKDQLMAARDSLPSESFKQFIPEYNNLIRRVSYIQSNINNNYEEVEDEYRNLIIDLEDFTSKLEPFSAVEKTAASGGRDPVNWFKRKNVELLQSRYDHMRTMRLKADDAAKEARNSLDRFMDALEKPHVNPASLVSYLKSFISNLTMVYKYVYKLGDIHNSRAKLKNYKSRGKDKWPVISQMDLRALHRSYKEVSSIGNKLESLQELHG